MQSSLCTLHPSSDILCRNTAARQGRGGRDYRRAAKVTGDSQVARDRRARRLLGRLLWRAVLVRITEACAVDEPERVRVVEQRVEDRARIEDSHLIEVSVVLLECVHARRELAVVVRKRGIDIFNRPIALLKDQRGAVRRWDCQEQEGACAVLVEFLDLQRVVS